MPDDQLYLYVREPDGSVRRVGPDERSEGRVMGRTVMLRNSVRDPHATGTTWWNAQGHGLTHIDADGDDGIGGCVEMTRITTSTVTRVMVVKAGTVGVANGYLSVSPGDTVGAIASVKPISGAAFNGIDLLIVFYNASGEVVSFTTVDAKSITSAGEWERLAGKAVAPADAAFAVLNPGCAHSSASGVVVRFDRALLAIVPDDWEPDPNLFFSGSGYTDPDTGLWTPDPLHKRVAWEGEENASTSVLFEDVPLGEASADDSGEGLALADYQFASTLPGGFSTADVTAVLPPQPIELPRKMAPAEIRAADGSLVWQGRVFQVGEGGDDGTLELQLIGHDAALKDDPSITFVGVLTDLGEWGEPPRQWVRSESQADRVVNRRLTASVGEGGLQITMDTDVNVQAKHRGVAWLSLPAGQRVGRIEYVASQLAATDMQTQFTFTPETLQGADVHPTTNDLTVRAVVPTEPTRHVRAVATPATTVNKANEFVWTLHRVSVFGDHGLPRYPIGSNTPAGLRWSDVIERLVGQHTTLATDITPSSVVAQQIAILEPTDLGEIIEQALELERDRDWAVYPGEDETPTLMIRPRRDFGRVWVARRGEGADFSGLGPTSEPDHDSVVVAFDDQDGVRRTVGPPGSGCDVEDASLRDDSPDNPVTSSPVVTTRPKLVEVSDPIDTDKAIEIGQIALAELLEPRYSGEIQLPRFAECEGERLPTYLLRAGDRIVDGDSPGGPEMLVVEASYAQGEERPCRVQVEMPADRLDAALARLSVRPRRLNVARLRRQLRRERRRRRHSRSGPAKGRGREGRGRLTRRRRR